MTAYSENETASLFRKAVIGAGFDVGTAEDGARAAIALVRHGLEASVNLLDAIEKAQKSHQGKRNSTLVHALPEIEVQLHKPLPATFEVKAIDAPAMLIGLAAVAAKDHAVRIEMTYENGTRVILSPGKFTASGEVPDEAAFVRFHLSTADEPVIPTKPSPISIAPNIYQALSNLAAKTYVPATEASRLKGAGAGTSDND